MPESFNAALLFLINTVFDLYLFILVVRMVLVYVGSNYYDPITQFIVKLTDFIVKPLRRFIPNIRRAEIVTLILIILLEVIKFLLISTLSFGFPNFLGIILLAMGDILKLFISTFFYAILLQALMSWIQPASPMNRVLYQFTSPIMYPLQRVVPLVNGIDLSPIPALLGLQLIIILLVNPLMALGLATALG